MLYCKFESYLVVTLSGAAVNYCVRVLLNCNVYKTFGNAGSRRAGAEKITLILRSCFKTGYDVVVSVIICQVKNIEFGSARL